MLQKQSCQDRNDLPSSVMDAGSSFAAQSSQHNRPYLRLPFLGGALRGHGSNAFFRSCSKPVPRKQSYVALVSVFGVSREAVLAKKASGLPAGYEEIGRAMLAAPR